MTRITINGQTLEYEDEIKSIIYKNIKPITESEARSLIHKTKELFDRAGIKFSLSFGSLLGAIRDKGLIKGDEDIDIFVMDEEKLRSNLISLQEDGLKVCRICPGLLYSFRINPTCYIDVYILRELMGLPRFLWGWYCVSLAGNETPRKFFTGFQEIEFLGEKVMCPENPERLLEFWYGPDWRIPVRGHSFIYRVKSAHYYHKIMSMPPIRMMKNTAKFILSRSYRQKILQRKKETGSFFNR
ncbi:MAG: LicD family protein [Synergistaceae bacterium]|nr:LicD family protein [Synergistaceae bacterium]